MCEWRPDFEALDKRVDALETSVAVIKATQSEIREEMHQGFADLKEQVSVIYEERRAWSAWLRTNLPVVGKWIAKWVIIITVAAIGINNAPALINVVVKAMAGAASAAQQSATNQ